LRGPDQIKGWMQAFFNAFPDISHPIDKLVVAGDDVTTELTVTGTHTGALRTPEGEIPPTHKEISMRCVNVTTVAGEMITSVHIYYDQMEFMGQLGLLPA
jgi:predicted ester cyclase